MCKCRCCNLKGCMYYGPCELKTVEPLVAGMRPHSLNGDLWL